MGGGLYASPSTGDASKRESCVMCHLTWSSLSAKTSQYISSPYFFGSFSGRMWFFVVVDFVCLVLGFWGFGLLDSWFVGFLGFRSNEMCATQQHLIVMILCAFHTCMVVMTTGVHYDPIVDRCRDSLLDAAHMRGEVSVMLKKG